MSYPPATLGDRSLFPDLVPRVYLNHAAVSPPSLPVRDAAMGMLQAYAREGVGAAPHSMHQRERLKAALSNLIGASAQELALVPSTTWGITQIAHAVPWRRGDRVVLFEGEFPANVTPWQRAAAEYGLDIRWVKAASFARSESEGLAEVDRALSGGARLMAVSFVQFRDGLRMPLQALADRVHAAGGELFVDAIQGVGIVPLEVSKASIDYLACGAHKWLMALEGAAFLYVRRERQAQLTPRLPGWLSHEEPLSFLLEGERTLRYDKPLQKAAAVFEGSSASAVGFAALSASLDLIVSLGVEAIYAHVQRYHDALERPLERLGLISLRPHRAEQRSGILSFELPGGAPLLDLAHALRKDGVACTTPDGALRFSPHWPNALDEVPCVIEAVERALRSTK